MSVGKTSFISQHVKGKFSDQYRITVGADLFATTMNVDGKEVSLQVILIDLGYGGTREVSNYGSNLLSRI